MAKEDWKRSGVVLCVAVVAAIAFSLIFHIPYVFTALGFSGWAFFGHLVTADDDAPGGWSNPDGRLPFPWVEPSLKGLVFVALCVVAISFPPILELGRSR